MNAPAELAKVLATAPDATHGYKSFTLGSFTFRRDEYFAHISWKTRDGRPLSHTMDAGTTSISPTSAGRRATAGRCRTRWTRATSCAP